MSLPLPRRIAQAALLLGAAAAPLVGAGAAHAASLTEANLGGLSTLDNPALGDALATAEHQGAVLGAQAGTDAMKATLPATDHVVGTTTRSAVPTAQQALERTHADPVDAAGRLAGGTTESAAGTLSATELVPTTPLPPLVPNAGTLPTTEHLPLNGLPVL